MTNTKRHNKTFHQGIGALRDELYKHVSIKSRNLTLALEDAATPAEREQIAVEAKERAAVALARARREYQVTA